MNQMACNFKSSWITFPLLAWLFMACNDNRDKWYPIPEDASAVAVIAPARISKKIVWDKLGEFNLLDLFDFPAKDTAHKRGELAKLLANPEDAGIGILENFYLFKKRDQLGIFASLDSEDDISKFVKDLGKIPEPALEYQYVFLDSILLAWNGDICVLLIKEDLSKATAGDLESIVKLKKESSLFSNPDFKKSSAQEADILVWFNLPNLIKEYPMNLQIAEALLNTSSTALINFEDGKVTLELKDLLNKKATALLKNAESSSIVRHLSYTSSASYTSAGVLNINLPKAFEFASGDSGKAKLHKLNLSEKDLTETFTGEILFTVFEIVESTKTFTSYSYDEDFNKTEITDTIRVSYPSFAAFIETRHKEKSVKLLNTLLTKGLIEQAGKNYKFTFGQVPVEFTVQEEGILITNRTNEPAQRPFEPRMVQELSSYPVITYLSPASLSSFIKPKFRPSIPLNQVNTALAMIKKNEHGRADLSAEIIFADTTRNSLLTLMKILKGIPVEQF